MSFLFHGTPTRALSWSNMGEEYCFLRSYSNLHERMSDLAVHDGTGQPPPKVLINFSFASSWNTTPRSFATARDPYDHLSSQRSSNSRAQRGLSPTLP